MTTYKARGHSNVLRFILKRLYVLVYWKVGMTH